MEPELLRVDEARHVVALGRSKMYELILDRGRAVGAHRQERARPEAGPGGLGRRLDRRGGGGDPAPPEPELEPAAR